MLAFGSTEQDVDCRHAEVSRRGILSVVASRTIVFADLAGFTAATDVHGDDVALDLATRFCEITRENLGPNDVFVKSIGDAVMCTAPDPAAGIALVQAIVGRLTAERGFPDVRVGLHHGSVLERNGDVFGAAVNLAARVAAHAGASQVLTTTEVAAVAREIGVTVTDLGEVEFRNVAEPWRIFELGMGCRDCGFAVDPVCKMRVERVSAAARVRHAGIDWCFCSLDCVARFATDPGRYAIPTQPSNP